MKHLAFCIFIVLTTSCSTPAIKETHPREYQLGAYLWQQTSGEYKALCFQAYNLARSELEKTLNKKTDKRKGIILDIDETVFDNSRSATKEIRNNIPWSPNLFNDWVKEKRAIAISGAVDFLNFAKKNSIEIFYITNRTEEQVSDTLENLKKLGMPAKRENIFPLNKQWSKELRRQEIQRENEIVLFIGDNLHDFNSMWDKKSSQERVQLVEKHKNEFGTKYIVLPNPLYGDWETALPQTPNKADLLLSPI